MDRRRAPRGTRTRTPSGGRVRCTARPCRTVERMNGCRPASNVPPADQQDQHVIDAVAVQPFRRRPADLVRTRFDPELLDFHSPRWRPGGEAAEERVAEPENSPQRGAIADV